MRSTLRLVGILGCAMVLLGGLGFVAGGYMAANGDCVSGTSFAFEPVDEAEATDLAGNTTAFADLAPVEQRIFLEAYTDSSERAGESDVYVNWSEEWFNQDQSNVPFYVEYRGDQYEVMLFATDCGVSTGGFVQIGGILGSLLGVAILAVAGVWRVYTGHQNGQ